MRSTLNASSIIAIALLIVISSCSEHRSMGNKHPGKIVAQTFRTVDGWGYTIFVNDKLFIKQSVIPVIEGNKGFAKEEDAIKMATLVVNKIKLHEVPAIRLSELEASGIVSK